MTESAPTVVVEWLEPFSTGFRGDFEGHVPGVGYCVRHGERWFRSVQTGAESEGEEPLSDRESLAAYANEIARTRKWIAGANAQHIDVVRRITETHETEARAIGTDRSISTDAHKRATADLMQRIRELTRESAMRREAAVLLAFGLRAMGLKYGKSECVTQHNIERLMAHGCRRELAEFIAGVVREVYRMKRFAWEWKDENPIGTEAPCTTNEWPNA